MDNSSKIEEIKKKLKQTRDLYRTLELHGKWAVGLRGGERADLQEADLHGVNLRYTNLREAYLWRADLRNTDLSEADLRGSYLYGANLSEADLRGANLRGADLRKANFQRTKLLKADLEVIFSFNDPEDVDLSEAVIM